MKVLYVSDSYLPSPSANSVHVMKMCEAFAHNGHQVVLIAMSNANVDHKRIFEYYGVSHNFTLRLSRLRPIKGVLFLHAFRNLRFIMRMKPDFVFGRSYISLALLSLIFPSLRFAFETHNPVAAMNRFQRWAFYKIVRRAKSIVTISAALQSILRAELSQKHSNAPILVHHDGASIPAPMDSTMPALKRNVLQVGYIGTVQKGRGIEQIILLCSELPMIEFHIVGGTMRDLTDRLGILSAPANLILHGYQSPSATQRFRDSFDILLAPYQRDTTIKSGLNTSAYMSPLKIFEYMASAKPIIASDLPVIREVLNEDNSLLVEPESILAWKRAILELEDGDRRKALGQQAFTDVKTKYTWQLRAQNILDENV